MVEYYFIISHITRMTLFLPGLNSVQGKITNVPVFNHKVNNGTLGII